MRAPFYSICLFLWFGSEALAQLEEVHDNFENDNIEEDTNVDNFQSESGKFGFNFQLGDWDEGPSWDPPVKSQGWGWQPEKPKGWGWPGKGHHHHHHHHHHKGKKGRRHRHRPKKGWRRPKKPHKKGYRGPRLRLIPGRIKFLRPQIKVRGPRIVIKRPKLKFVKGR